MSDVPKVERYEVCGFSLSIEDFDDGKPDSVHFFGEERRRRRGEPRFLCWSNGYDIATSKTIAEARAHLHAYAVNRMTTLNEEAKTVVEKTGAALKRLGDDVFNLGKFSDDVATDFRRART